MNLLQSFMAVGAAMLAILIIVAGVLLVWHSAVLFLSGKALEAIYLLLLASFIFKK